MPTNKALVGLVIGMGAIIVVGLAMLSYGLIRRGADPSFKFFSTAPASAPSSDLVKGGGQANITVPLPTGTSVVSVTRSGDQLMVHIVDEDDNSAVLFIDPNDGRIVRRIAFGGRR